MTTEEEVYDALKHRIVVGDNGTRRYYNNLCQLHREDGPAIVYADNTKVWYQNGVLHREDGPAIERTDGTKEWYQNGKRHRADGPAIEWETGKKEWWLNGTPCTEQEYLAQIKTLEHTVCPLTPFTAR